MNVTMQMQILGRGEVLLLAIQGTAQISVAVSAMEFVKALQQLSEQARAYPDSLLRNIRIETGEH